MNQKQVILFNNSDYCVYPKSPPYHPDKAYPECKLKTISEEKNIVYNNIRECFRISGLDKDKYGTPKWNPLGELITPGEKILLKPNLVKEFHPREPEGWRYVLTHGSVIRAVADYVALALKGEGKIIVADAPQTDSSFTKIDKLLGLSQMAAFFTNQGIDFEVVDLRKEEWINQDGVITARHILPGDPQGYIAYDLANQSEFVGHLGAGRYYGADYDTREINVHHSEGRHEYLIAGTAIEVDVIFSLPKLKTHKKAGITVTLKNLVGINGDKNWLPHHTEGDPTAGGDERPCVDSKGRTERNLVHLFRKLSLGIPGIGPWLHRIARRAGKKVFGDTEEIIRSGNWWGNDTVWRMCLDLNKIALYGRSDGQLSSTPMRRHYTLVDGIIAGEGRGPMNPDPVAAGVLLFGVNPASVDAVCACLMGFDPEKIPIVRQAFRCRHLPLAHWEWRDVQVISNKAEWNQLLAQLPGESLLNFEPHYGWKDNIEQKPAKKGVAT
jgi:uncharacterized protein (DUF362 family)